MPDIKKTLIHAISNSDMVTDSEMHRILDIYDPGGIILSVRSDLIMDYYEDDIGTKYRRIKNAMIQEVHNIESGW